MTHEDNVLLTRVEGQAPMGEMPRAACECANC